MPADENTALDDAALAPVAKRTARRKVGARLARRHLLSGAAGVGTLAALAGVGAAPASAASAEGIVGTWLVTVTPPRESGRPSFQYLALYTADGGIIASESVPLAAAAPSAMARRYRGIGGLGRWSKTAENTYATTLLWIGSDQQRQGAFVHYLQVRERITLQAAGTASQGQAVVEHVTADGLVLDSHPNTSQARRVSVEPLAP